MNVEEVLHIEQIEVRVKRTRRVKTLGIRISQGRVLVNAPQHLTLSQVKHLLLGKKAWLQDKLTLEVLDVVPSCYREGALVDFVGEQYRLGITPGRHGLTQIVGDKLQLSLPQSQIQPRLIRNALIRWYKKQALHYLSNRVDVYGSLLGVKPTCIKIKTFKARWGSCSAQGVINFNWHLMMAPPRVLDYVVAHEVCHLLEFNHSKAFWNLVEKIMPDYKEQKFWLKRHGSRLLDKIGEPV